MGLIEADEFLYDLTHWYDKYGFSHDVNESVFHLSEIEFVIERQPTIDPVKHGRWKCSDDGFMTAICSCCGAGAEAYEFAKTYFNFCPNCGCCMDEVEG